MLFSLFYIFAPSLNIMQTKKIVVASIFFFLMITLGLVFRPLPSSSSENTVVFTGIIEQVVETGNKNVVFKLENDDRFYFIEEGLPLNAEVSNELVQSIFHPEGPLHDGAMLIRAGRVVSAGSISRCRPTGAVSTFR